MIAVHPRRSTLPNAAECATIRAGRAPPSEGDVGSDKVALSCSMSDTRSLAGASLAAETGAT